MKIDGSTLFYILVGLGSIIYSAYSQNKKKHQQEHESSPTYDEYDTDSQSVPEQVVIPTVKSENNTDIFGHTYKAEGQLETTITDKYNYDDAILKNIIISNIASTETEIGTINAFKMAEEDDHNYLEVDYSSIEPAKAIIYAEIINRKYF